MAIVDFIRDGEILRTEYIDVGLFSLIATEFLVTAMKCGYTLEIRFNNF